MGDALAIALVDKRKFRETDFYKFHPGGSLGARLRATVRDAMVVGDRIPRVPAKTSARKAIAEIDRMNVGFVLVTDNRNNLLGIMTDGDVRRLVSRGTSFEGLTIDEIMTANPKTIDEKASLAETVEFMQKKEITTLAVVNEKKKLKGYVHLHDIFGRGGSVNISLTY
jgi:arabinose-5-phosphate isomerase